MIKYIDLFFILFMLYALCNGDENINGIDDFVNFASNVNSGSSYSGETVSLTADIDFNDDYSSQFIPIGTDSKYFGGTFDGKGHVISNLKISNSSSVNVGLFGRAPGGTIKNIVLDSSCTISCSFEGDNEEIYIGGIVGFSASLTKNSVVMSTVSFTGNITNGHYSYVGGIAGYLSGNVNITNCAFYGTILHEGTSSKAYIGGIVGYFVGGIYGPMPYANNNLNFGSIKVTQNIEIVLGGIVGKINYVGINNCVALGTVKVAEDKYSSVYGIVGSDDSTNYITYCFWVNYTNDTKPNYGTSSQVKSSSLITSLNTTFVGYLNDYSSSNNWNEWILNCGENDVPLKMDNGKEFVVSTQLILSTNETPHSSSSEDSCYLSYPRKESSGSSLSSSSSFSPSPPPFSPSPPPFSPIPSSSSSIQSSSSSIHSSSSSNSLSSSSSLSSPTTHSSSSSSSSSSSLSPSEKNSYISSSIDSRLPNALSSTVFSSDDQINPSSVGKGNKSKGNTLLICLIVLVILVVVIISAVIVFFALIKNKKGKENDIELSNMKARRRALTEVCESTPSEVSPVVSICQMDTLYPQDYKKPALKDALCEAGLTDSESATVCAECATAAEKARLKGGLFEGFTEDDAAAVAVYTYDFGSNKFDSNPYRLINGSLASYDPEGIRKVRGLLCLVMAALRKLPRTSGRVLYRGIRGGVNLEDGYYSEGNTIAWAALTSTSPDMKATKAFLAKGSKTGKATGTLFIIEGAWGYNIQPYSLFPDEEEIVLEPGSQFTVESVIDAEGIIIITLTMIKTPGIQQEAWK